MPVLLAWLGGLNWGKVLLWVAILGALAYGYHIFKQNTVLTDKVGQLEANHVQDAKTIEDMKAQYAKNLKLVKREHEHDVKIQLKTQAELNTLKNTSSTDDGPIRNVLSNTLSWLRNNTSSSDSSSEGTATSGATHAATTTTSP